MTKLFNPTDNNLVVTILGVEYTLSGNGTIELEDSVAKYWKKELHQFLVDADEVKENNVEATAKEEVKDEVKEVVKKVTKKK